ncbi:protein-export chaperone SecB [Litorivicinus sp.]|jgi:preprotein translocase subunit SecB|nr:protein-export chaperone SecB [Litorivicinus sp.]MDC1319253.1 protein-export chaperone SecB [Litorivicinus sp.]|tara:strand:- start:49776 stop:50210 length:435 start_codon:yes stop_codon:yes gene_type:complete
MSEQDTQNFSIVRIFTKDLSLESPKAPQIFEKKWDPKLALEVAVTNNKLADYTYEVVLKMGVTVQTDEEVAFLIEIQQAGVFLVQGFDDATVEHVLGSMCPNILFPYARETIDSLAVKATFPAPMLAPINFDALLEQRKEQVTN